MKYNININQLVLSETNLDIIDCAILDYLIFICSSASVKIEKQRKNTENGSYTWVNFNKLLEDMPLLRIKSKGALTPRLRKIEEEGYISIILEQRKLFIKMNDKVDEVFIQMNKGVHTNEQRCSPKRTNNNTIDNNTIDNEITCEDKPRNETQELLNIFYENLNPNIKFQNKTLRSDAEFLVSHYPLDKLKAIVLYIKEHQGEQFFPSITTPSQLRDKMAQIINYKNREPKGSKIIKI